MPKAWIPSTGAKVTIIYHNVGSTGVFPTGYLCLIVVHQLCMGPMLAGYVAIQLNHIQLFPWMEDEVGEGIPIDAATNCIACLAFVLNGVFCTILFTVITATLREIGLSARWKWLTSDANYPYHVWLVVGIVAAFLDYVALFMFASPRWPFAAAFTAFLLLTVTGFTYVGVRKCILGSASILELTLVHIQNPV